MAATESLTINSGSTLQRITSLAQKLMNIARIFLPKFVEEVDKFHSTLCGIVNDLIANFDTSNYEATKRSCEAIEVCQELKKMMSYCNAYMAKVNKFAWFAKREARKQAILQGIQQNDHNLAPLKDYIEQLKRSLIQAEEGSEELDKSFDGVQQRLQTLVANCEERLDKNDKKKLKFAMASGGVGGATGVILFGGAVAVAGAIAAPTLGLGSAIVMCIASSGMALAGTAATLASAGALYSVEQYEKAVYATQAFISNLQLLRSISQSIQGTITDVQQELKRTKQEIEGIETLASPHESLVNLTESLQYFFEELTNSGNRCSEFYEQLRQKEVLLEKVILKVLSSLVP